jgi:hypothetical protein
VVYAFGNTEAGTPFLYELRTVALGDTTTHLLFQNEDGDDWVAPAQWHATAGVLAVRYRADGSIRLGTIARPGDFRTIRTFAARDGHPRAAALSPDGRMLAVGRLGDIWLMRADGTGERSLDLGGARLLGWAPAGDALLVHAERAGERGVWSVAVANGRRTGEPVLVRGGIPALVPGGMAGDRYFYRVPVDGRRVYLAGVDVDAARVIVQPTALTTPGDGSAGDPAWAPDGRSFAYILRPPNDDIRVMLRSGDGEHARVLASTRFTVGRSLEWAPDGRALYMISEGLRGHALYRIHVDDGRFERVVDPAGRAFALLPDHSGVILAADALSHYDFATGATRVLLDDHRNRDITVSPDGRDVIIASRARGGSSIIAVPIQGGAERTLFTLPDGEHVEPAGQNVRFTPDGRFLLVVVGDAEQRHRLVAYPMDGGSRRTLLDLGQRTEGAEFAHARVHPDGRRLVYAHGEDRAELWVLELTGAGGR